MLKSVGHITSTRPGIAINMYAVGISLRSPPGVWFRNAAPTANAPDPGSLKRCSVISQLIHPSPPQLPLELLHLTQANPRRNPPEADQSAEPLALRDLLMSDPETGDASLQRFVRAGRIFPLQDAAHDVVDVALVSVLHGGREVALAFGLCTVLANYRSAEDFNFGNMMMRL